MMQPIILANHIPKNEGNQLIADLWKAFETQSPKLRYWGFHNLALFVINIR